MFRTLILVSTLGLLFACGSSSGFTGSTYVGTPPVAPTSAPVALNHGHVVSSIEVPLSLDVDHGHVLSTALSLISVPSASNIVIYPFLNAAAGNSLQNEIFGYFDAAVQNNSNALNSKTDIYLALRFASAATQFTDSTTDTLTISVIKPQIGSEASAINAVPVSATAGSGVRAYTFCNVASGSPCASHPVVSSFVSNVQVMGNFNVPAGTYNGTMVWELVTN